MALDPNATNVDPSTFAQSRGIATLPSNNADDSGREPVSSSPVNGQLQPPSAQTPAQPLQLQPGVTTPAIEKTANPRLSGFIASVLHGTLSALAGKAPTQYTTDQDGRVVANPVQPKDSPGRQLGRLALHALEGLGAGASVPQQKSGAASALAGLGAGANAATASANAADAKARQQAREDEEAKQQKILRMHDIAKGNLLMASTWQHLMDTEQDRDPARAQHLDWAKAAEAAGVPVKYVTESEAQQIRKTDPQALAKFQVLPVGMKDVVDADGNPVLDENGKPHREGRFALIDGFHDGNIPAPASFVSDLNKYGQYAGLSKEEISGLNAGDDLSMQSFIKLANSIQEGKKRELQGWATPKNGWAGADGKMPVEINSVTGEQRPYPAGVTPNIKNEPAESAATVKEKNAKAAKDQKDANAGPTSNLTGEDYLKTLPVARQGIVRGVGEGRQALPANRKEALAILEDVHQSYPDFDESKGKVWQKTRNEYMGTGATAKALVSANTALAHLQRAFDHSTYEGIYNPLSKDYQALNADITYITGEVGKAVKGGVISEGEAQHIRESLNGGLTPGLKRERIKETAKLLHDKMDETQTKFNDAAPSSAVKVPVLMHPSAGQAYDYIQADGKIQPAQNPQSGQAQNQTPAPTTHSVSISTAMKNHPGMTEDQVRAWAKQNNYEVVQ
jgi:hypothetical protein